MSSTSGTRGIRNNNPGNIDRHADTKWQGAAADQSGDKRFVVFKAPEWGIRAIVKTLLTYQSAYGIKTIRGVINRWAPPNDFNPNDTGPKKNDTTAYINAVARAVGVKPTEVIQIDSCEIMFPLVNAIIAHENSGYKYPDKVVLEGMRRAGVHDVKPQPLFSQTAFKAQVGAGASLVAGGGLTVAEYAPAVKSWADKLSDFTGSPIIQHIATGLISLAGILVLIGLVSKVLKQRAA